MLDEQSDPAACEPGCPVLPKGTIARLEGTSVWLTPPRDGRAACFRYASREVAEAVLANMGILGARVVGEGPH